MEDVTIHLAGRNYSLLHNEIFLLLRGAAAVNAFAAGGDVRGPTQGASSGHAWAMAGGDTGHPIYRGSAWVPSGPLRLFPAGAEPLGGRWAAAAGRSPPGRSHPGGLGVPRVPPGLLFAASPIELRRAFPALLAFD